MTPTMLANDGGIFDPALPALGWGVVLYLTAVVSAKVISGRPWLWGFLVAAVWGIVFPVFQTIGLLLLIMPDWREATTPWEVLLPASVVSAGLLGWASRSPLPPAGVVIGYVLTGLLAEVTLPEHVENPSVTLACLPWHIGTTTGLLVWALRERWSPRHDVGRCPACGYDLTGLRTRTCPECGGKGRSLAPPLYRPSEESGTQ